MVDLSSVVATASGARRWQGIGFGLAFGLLVVGWLVIIALMFVYRPALGPALLITILLMGLAAIRPRAALSLAIVAGVLGDGVATPWWPATKNLSSFESVLYVSDALTIKPVDLILGSVVATILLARFLSPGAPRLTAGPLMRPLLVFTAAMVVGLAWGVGRGGDVRVAYFEAVPLLYVPLVYGCATNLFTSLGQYRRLLVAAVVAMSVECVFIIARLDSIRTSIGADQSAFEHSAAIHYNLAFLLTIAVGWFGAKRRWPRPVLVLAVLPILYVYLDGQRRAGIVALVIGVTVLAFVLYARDKSRFLRTIPALAVVGVVYLGVFWNASGQLGFPAQAVKSVIEPTAASESDAASDLYRDIENYDLNATIRSNPLLGVGFGREFHKPYPLPDIGAFFEFADYIPHNIILWIWLKTGIVGFVSFLYTASLAIATGVRAAVRMRRSADVAVIASFVAMIPMTVVVAFVDITIDPTTMMLLGLALAAATSAERLQAGTSAGDGGPEGTEPLEVVQAVAGGRRPAGPGAGRIVWTEG